MKPNHITLWLCFAATSFVGMLALEQQTKATASGPMPRDAFLAKPPEATEAATPATTQPAATASVAAKQANDSTDSDSPHASMIAQAETTPAPDATTTITTTTTHGGWTVTCKEASDPAQKKCSAEFRVVAKENKGVVLIWLLGRNAEGKLLAEFVTPSDILIKPGVSIVLGDFKPASKAEFVSCTSRKGCRASIDLTPKLVRELKEARKATIGLTLLNGKVMQIGVDIPGIAQALADLGG